MVTLRQAALQAIEALEKYDRTGNPVFWDQAEKVLSQALEAEQHVEADAVIDYYNFGEAIVKQKRGVYLPVGTNLYTHPQPAERTVHQPLTEEQISEAMIHVDVSGHGYYVRLARAIERAHGIS